MADPFADEVKWWKNRAAEFDKKRANLRPISFDYVSKSYSNSGNYNGASTFNSARAKLMAQDADMRSRLVYTPAVKPGTVPTHNSVLKPSADVIKLDAQNDKTENKIKELGGNAFRSVVGGLTRVADLLSRTGYALRASSMHYAKENAASNGTSMAEHFENIFRPVVDMATFAPRAAAHAVTGTSDPSLTHMWAGFQGKEKVWGHDLMKVIYPEFTSDHKKWTSVLGFATDVIYDPLSWVTLGQGTVVTGAAKGTAAIGVKALGKGKLAEDLLSNTVWTATGRKGGIEAVREGLYLKATKPVVKKQKKAANAVTKLDAKTAKSLKAGEFAKAAEYSNRAQKAQAISAKVTADTAAELKAIHAESYTGMRLAWKAVANKSIGIGSFQDFSKGVNTAGLSGRSARAFSTLQKASHDDIKARFKSPDSPEGMAWRAGHKDLVDSGQTTFTYSHGGAEKTFTVADDYDQFVDDFVDRGFKMRGLSEITKKDRRARNGMLKADDAEQKRFFNSYMEHLETNSTRVGDILKSGGGAGRKAAHATRGALVAEKTKTLDEVVKIRETEAARAAAHDPALSPAQNQLKAAEAAAAEAKANQVKLAEKAHREALAESGMAEASLKAAQEAGVTAKAAMDAAVALRNQALVDEKAIQSAVDEVLSKMGDAQAGLGDAVGSHLAGQSSTRATLDQITGVSPVGAMIRDQMSAKGQAVFDEALAGLRSGLSDTSIHPGIKVDEAGQVGGIPGLTQGMPMKNAHTREINYRVAKAIQEVYDHTRTRLIAEELENDAELAFDALAQSTTYILNNLFGDAHMQTLVHLNELGYSTMASTPEIGAVISNMLGTKVEDLLPLNRALDPADKTKWGPSAVRNMDGTDWNYYPQTLKKTKGELRDTIIKTIDAMHEEHIFTIFGLDKRTDLTKLSRKYDALVEAKGVEGAAGELGALLLRAVEKNDVARQSADRLVNGEKFTAEEILIEFSQLGAALNAANHSVDSVALGHYTLYDYWTYGANIAKETDPNYNLTSQGEEFIKAAGTERRGIGRVGDLGTAAKAAKAAKESGIINEAISTIPAMDPHLVSLVGHVKGMMQGEYGFSDFTMKAIKPIVAMMLMGDLQKLAVKGADGALDFAKVNPEAALSTLGTHLMLLSDTTGKVATAHQINLANVVWGTPARIDKLNQSILLYNLHMVLNERLGPQAAAQRIAEKLQVNPEVAAMMQKAAADGTTNGTVGRKAPKAADPGVIQRQATEAADRAILEWEAKNPAPVGEATDFGKPTVPGDDYGKYLVGDITNPTIRDKVDTLTYAQAEDVTHIPGLSIHTVDDDELKIFNIGNTGMVLIKGLKDPKGGTSLYLVREKGFKAFKDAKGDVKKVDKETYHRIRIPSKAFEGKHNDVVVGDVLSSLVAKNVGKAGEVDPAAHAAWQASRQAEHARLVAAEAERLKAAAGATPTGPAAVDPKLAALKSKLSQELDKQKIATQQAHQNAAAATTKSAQAVNDRNAALATQQSAANRVETTKKSLADAKAIDTNVSTAPTAGAGGPGGFTAPTALTPAQIASIDTLIEDLTKEINVLGINNGLEEAKSAMNQAFSDYDAMVRENAATINMKTRYMLKFAGVPIMPVARSTKSPVATYAGVVAMKESQGRVGNWITTRAWYDSFDKKLRRPSSRHEALLEDMRRALANNAQNRLVATHKAVKATYSAFKNKAELDAAVRAFWDKSIPDVAKGLRPVADRFLGLQNEVMNRALRSTGLTDIDNLTIPQKAKLNEALLENARLMNNSLPKPYRVPDDIFVKNATREAFDGGGAAPWSREWMIALSERLATDNATHPLAKGNLEKLDFRAFDYASQHANSRVQLNTALHDSMFNHFTFEYDPAMIAVLNKNAPNGAKYVKVSEKYPQLSSVYKDVGDRYAPEDMLSEMNKISQFMLDQNRGWGSDLNFRTFERINNYWKAVVTTWNIPRYHIGNAMSDGFLSAMDGVGITSYRKSSTVMVHSHELRRKVGQDPEAYESFLRPDLNFKDVNNERDLATALGEIGDPKRAKHISTIRIQGQTKMLSSEDFYKAYLDFGLAQTQVNGNLLRSSSGKFSRMSNITDGVLDLSNLREDYFRMAHFIHAVESEAKVPGRSMQEVFKSARDRVVKYHFDYGDVSEIERTTVGRYMPFYKWTRNIVPLAMTQMITNPKTYVVNNAANKAMGEAMFPTQYEDDGTAIPVSYITPSWVGDANAVPIGHYTDAEGNEQARYAVLNLPLDQALANWIMPFVNPFLDTELNLRQQMSKGVTNTASSMAAASNPFIKAGMQAATMKTTVPGDSFDAKEFDWLKTLATPMVPFLGPIMQADKDRKKGVANSAAWAMDNFVGAIRETANTESGTKGEIHAQGDRLQGQFKKTSDLWIKQFYPDVTPGSQEAKDLVHDHLVGRGGATKVSDYAEFLESSMGGRHEALAGRAADLMAKMQAAKSLAAPSVMGAGGATGGGVGGSQSLSAVQMANMANFKTVGGKTVPVKGRLSQNWGKSNIHYSAGRHTGMDFGVPQGTNVRAAANGIVTRVGGEGAYGNSVHIRHPDGTTSLYGHLSGYGVKVGQKVKSGQSIAKSGNTGRSTGAHLHFELRSRDSYGSDVNPAGWLQKR